MNRTKFNLTGREEETLKLLLMGYSNVEIANNMSVSVHTIKAHVESIYRKFGVHNKVQATIFAIVHELVDASDYIL